MNKMFWKVFDFYQRRHKEKIKIEILVTWWSPKPSHGDDQSLTFVPSPCDYTSRYIASIPNLHRLKMRILI